MLLSREIENSLLRLREKTSKYYPDSAEMNYEKHYEESGAFNLLNQNYGSLIIFFDIKKIKIVNISENITNFTGYNRTEFDQDKTLSFMSLLAPEHIPIINVFATWIQELLQSLAGSYKTAYFLNCWGAKFYNKAGELMRWYVNTVPLELDTNGKPILMFISIQDITHLIKGEDYWIRGVFGKDKKRVFVYRSGEDKTIEQEILSEREKEILKYIIQGLNTKQIAEVLDISPNTVDNHRRNMLARTGTRDTTALIHLCKMMEIV